MPGTVTIYNRKTKEKVTMYSVQARQALRNHPDEWTESPVAGAIERRAIGQTIEPHTKTGTEVLIPAGDLKRDRSDEKGGEHGAPKPQGPVSTSREQHLRGGESAVTDAMKGSAAADDLDDEYADDVADGDDFTQIKGIGPALQDKMGEAGITTYAQLRDMSDDDAKALETKLGQPGAFERNDWRGQAKKLSSR